MKIDYLMFIHAVPHPLYLTPRVMTGGGEKNQKSQIRLIIQVKSPQRCSCRHQWSTIRYLIIYRRWSYEIRQFTVLVENALVCCTRLLWRMGWRHDMSLSSWRRSDEVTTIFNRLLALWATNCIAEINVYHNFLKKTQFHFFQITVLENFCFSIWNTGALQCNG